jgi:UDP-N-acetylglucosamine 4,6-dehydratase
MIHDKKILITGGTGSLGKKLVERLAKNNKVIIYSRDEGKQASIFNDNKNVLKVIGDIRDYSKLNITFKIHQPDYIIHTAALKRIDDMEFYPDECIKTNINGSENVARAAINNNIKKCILVSTDKACLPVNVYGSSKFISERIFTNYDYNSTSTIFSSVRYGNVIASRGSFIPLWIDKIKNNKTIPLTSTEMTRFLFTLDDAVETVLQSLIHSIGGEVFIPQLNSFKINTVVKAVWAIVGKSSGIKLIGLRPGEKLHEDMLAKTELDFTYHVPLDTKTIKLLQVRPQYTNKVYKDYKKYEGLEFNSFLHLNNNVDFLKDLIIKGIS